MTPIQIILMTGIALLLLAVGVVVFLAAAAVWWEGKKIMSARDVVNQISTLQSALSAVRKDLQSTDEQLSAWMNRTAVRSRRDRVREEKEEPTMDPNVIFPSEVMQ